jgi:hypothetical protein
MLIFLAGLGINKTFYLHTNNYEFEEDFLEHGSSQGLQGQ